MINKLTEKRHFLMLFVNEKGEIIEFISQTKDGIVFKQYNGKMIVVPLKEAEKFKSIKDEYVESAWKLNFLKR